MRPINDTIDLLANQNKLIKKMDTLLERQNQFLHRQITSTAPHEVFVNDIERDEMRNGFLVTSHRKKLWNVQIGLINEFSRICKKHNIKWFAFYGTLLGAARHKGFIPWDDDIDVIMFRHDYEILKKVIADEIKYPYRMFNWYDYSHEADGEISSEYEKTLPLITIRQTQECPMWWPCRTMSRLIDERTTMMNNFDARKKLYTGIWLDIFIFDFMPPFDNAEKNFMFNIARELFIGTIYPDTVKKLMENNQKLSTPYSEMENFLEMSYRRKAMYFDDFMAKNFSKSQYITEFRNCCLASPENPMFSAEYFKDTVYLPFEKIELPVPAGWENCLTAQYGDWRKMVFTHTHSSDYSADIPYTEYYKTSAFMK